MSLLCVGLQLKYNYPNIYNYSLPAAFKSDNQNLTSVIDGKYVETPPWNHTVSLSSVRGQEFISFAKYVDYGQGTNYQLSLIIFMNAY